ncbi:MAG TPA: ABC transporter permease, partial [Terrabacter sp.]|nr:ABC transporter permease [Terrabacter sp.]
MLTYLIRRLLAAVLLLAIVSAVVFAIFFLVPRIGGATVDDLASRYVGKSAGQAQIHETAVRLGFTDPIWVQYGRFVKGIVAGADYNTGAGIDHCPAPCLGYSYITQNPVLPDILDRLPVTLILAAGAAVLWLIGGVGTGVISALRRGTALDRGFMGVALAGVSLPIFFTGLLALSIFSYGLKWTYAGGASPMDATSPLDLVHRMLLP